METKAWAKNLWSYAFYGNPVAVKQILDMKRHLSYSDREEVGKQVLMLLEKVGDPYPHQILKKGFPHYCVIEQMVPYCANLSLIRQKAQFYGHNDIVELLSH